MMLPYYQLDPMDYNLPCLRVVAKYYGKNSTLQDFRSKAVIIKSGVSMLGISDATESIGFRTHGYRLPSQYEVDDIRYFKDVFSRKEEIIVNSI